MGRLTAEFRAQQNPPHPLYKLSRKPFAVKLPVELQERLEELPGVSERVRELLVAAWRAGEFD